ncbi:hypothetical protein ACJMK2_019173 [Sinanodonta woodiana]|uniref:Uncharacterized protein n=1 Tax=Sinanodonta woodiana TaxID=1069815 RepID=A0ABD3UJ08_SINWO
MPRFAPKALFWETIILGIQINFMKLKNKIASDGRDQKSLYKITKHLMGASNEVVLPSSTSSKHLAQDFSNFFINKVEGIRNDIKTQNSLSNMNTNVLTPFSPLATNMMDFVPVSE